MMQEKLGQKHESPPVPMSYAVKNSCRGTIEWLAFTISTLSCETLTLDATCVGFSGSYWEPGGKREGGTFMGTVIAGALRGPAKLPSRFICDLSSLVYSGGDRLLGWRHQLRDGMPDAIVVSVLNRSRVESLIVDEDESALLVRVHGSLDEAMRALCGSAPS